MDRSDAREAAQIAQNKSKRIRALVPRDAPVLSSDGKPQYVIITGQPDAGKTTTQKNAAETLGASATTYDVDDNAEIHPRFAEFVRDNGLWGHAAVSAGCQTASTRN
ncbi:zeta toxin family protein [Nocardiopsis prasina]|uniref:zeta toxin family protein n=1 Tax=Nocardiopsis prasina TaxID=2015 RepID=UPI000378DA8F|nr:zeta toxin family protein [Nocardiopsis prasina]